MHAGGLAPAAFNAANEAAVAAFVEHRLSFTAIPKLVSQILEDLIAAETDIRARAQSLLPRYGNT